MLKGWPSIVTGWAGGQAPLTNPPFRIIYAPMIKNALHTCSYFWLYL